MAKPNGGIIGPSNVPNPFIAKGVWKLRDAFNYIKAGLWPSPLGYQVNNSLRFNSASNDFLSRTNGTPTNNKILTFSAWIKRSNITTYMDLFDQDGGTDYGQLQLTNVDAFVIYQRTSASTALHLQTTQLFRDVSAWYHLVVAYDTTQATASNRIKLYVNGTQVTSFSIETYPSQNLVIRQNTSGLGITVGNYSSGSNQYAGYMSEVYMIDGQALTPSSFGQTDSATGIWQPIAYTGSFGTNGFYLKFANSAALGTDSSGNGNNFTVNNLTSVDQSTDTPTNNFATINTLDPITKILTDGNLTLSGSSKSPRATFAFSKGKWYWECKLITQVSAEQVVGIVNETFNPTDTIGSDSNGWGYIIQSNANNGQAYHSNATIQYATFTTNDILNIAVDMDNQAIYFGKNGTWQNSGVPASGSSKTGAIYTDLPTSGLVFPAFDSQNSGGTGVISANFGSPPYSVTGGYTDAGGFGNFSYQPPSGYFSLCTRTLAALG